MSANLRNYTVALFGLDHVIRNVPDDAWENPSPCEGWSARDLTGHAIGVVNNVAARAGIGTVCDPFANPSAIAGDDVYATWYEIRNRALEALDRPGVLHKEVTSAAGVMSVDNYVATMLGDALIHTWDIARSTGGDEHLDPTLVAVVHSALLSRDPAALRAPGRFDPEVDAPADADAQTRLLCFAGRKV